MNAIERPDLEIIKTARDERLKLGGNCDVCNSPLQLGSTRMIVFTSVPKVGELPEVEVSLVCRPNCNEEEVDHSVSEIWSNRW